MTGECDAALVRFWIGEDGDRFFFGKGKRRVVESGGWQTEQLMSLGGREVGRGSNAFINSVLRDVGVICRHLSLYHPCICCYTGRF